MDTYKDSKVKANHHSNYPCTQLYAANSHKSHQTLRHIDIVDYTVLYVWAASFIQGL